MRAAGTLQGQKGVLSFPFRTRTAGDRLTVCDRNFLPSAIRDALSERLALKNTETARAGWH